LSDGRAGALKGDSCRRALSPPGGSAASPSQWRQTATPRSAGVSCSQTSIASSKPTKSRSRGRRLLPPAPGACYRMRATPLAGDPRDARRGRRALLRKPGQADARTAACRPGNDALRTSAACCNVGTSHSSESTSTPCPQRTTPRARTTHRTGTAPRRHPRRLRRHSHAAWFRTRARWRSSYVLVFVSIANATPLGAIATESMSPGPHHRNECRTRQPPRSSAANWPRTSSSERAPTRLRAARPTQ
jgi:hypothetical protein